MTYARCGEYDSCDEIDGWLTHSRSDGSEVQNIYPLIPMVPSDKRAADDNPSYAPGDPRPPFASVEPVLEAPAKDGPGEEARKKKPDGD